MVLFNIKFINSIPSGKYILSTDLSSNTSSSYTIEKLCFVYKESKLSIFTSNVVSDDAIETFIFVDLAIPRLTGPILGIVIISKSENSLNPDGCIIDFTDSFQVEYGTSLLIEYENFW